MTTPTISAVLPTRGHSGGRTLCEIQGTGFALPPAPDTSVLPVPTAVSRVRVLFGSALATDVEVLEDGATLLCLTPVHDPGLVAVTVQNLGETPAELVSGLQPFGLLGVETLQLRVNGGPILETQFTVDDFATPGAATAAEVAAVLNEFFGIKATTASGRVRLRTDARGLTASLEVVGGSAAAYLGFPSEVALGTTELEVIEGETVTAAGAFEFVRPSLTQKVPVTLALEQLLVELRRQVIENVDFAAHSDFDPDTGDLLNIAKLAKLPGIVLADVQLPDTMMPVGRPPKESDGEDGATMISEPEDLVDILCTMVAVTDNPIELFNMTAIVRRFFRKNSELVVGEESYPMAWEQGSPIAVTAQRGGDNLHTFTGQITVRAVPMGEMLIDYDGPMPTGMPNGRSREGVTELGFPQAPGSTMGVEASEG